jgi:hypothetical protein
MNMRTISASPNAISGSIKEAQARYGIGARSVREIAKAAGAVIKIGRSTRYHFPTMDAYMDSIRK